MAAKKKMGKLPGSGTSATTNSINMAVGNITSKPQPGVKTSGIKIRGTGAATKGTMARGPMG
jgi:hypothetical protein